MSASPFNNERPALQGIRRSFTTPARQLSFHERAGLDKSDADADVLYTHPHARIVSFSPPTESIKSTSKAEIPADTDYPVDTIETLPWRSRTETLAASGTFVIEKVRGSTNFLKCQTIMHAILRNSQCWCVDGESKFVLRVRKFQYYRIELPATTEEDKSKVEELKKVFPTVLRFERTPCPFIRAFTVDLPDDAITPRRKGQWKRRDSSLPNTSDTETPPLRRTKVERSWSMKAPPTSYPKSGPSFTPELERGRPVSSSGMHRRASLFETYRQSSPANYVPSDDGTDSERHDSERDSERESTPDRSGGASPQEQVDRGQIEELSGATKLISVDRTDTPESLSGQPKSTESAEQGDHVEGIQSQILQDSHLQARSTYNVPPAASPSANINASLDIEGSPSKAAEIGSEVVHRVLGLPTAIQPATSGENDSDQTDKLDAEIVQLTPDRIIPENDQLPATRVEHATSIEATPSSRSTTEAQHESSRVVVQPQEGDSTSSESSTEQSESTDEDDSEYSPLVAASPSPARRSMRAETEQEHIGYDTNSASLVSARRKFDTDQDPKPESKLNTTASDLNTAPNVRAGVPEGKRAEGIPTKSNSPQLLPPIQIDELHPQRTSKDVLSEDENDDDDRLSTASSLDSFHTLTSPTYDIPHTDSVEASASSTARQQRPLAYANFQHRRDISEVTVTASSASDPASPQNMTPFQAQNEQNQTPSLLRSSASDSSWPEPSTPTSAAQEQEGIRQRLKTRRSFSPLPPESTIFTGNIRHDSGSGHMTKAILQKVIVKPIEVVIFVMHVLARIASGATVSDLLSGELFKTPDHQRRVSGFADQLSDSRGGSETEDDYGVPIRGRRHSAERLVATVFDAEIQEGFEDVD